MSTGRGAKTYGVIAPLELDFSYMRDSRHWDAASWPDLQAFLAWRELGGAAPATLESYEWAIARFLRAYPDVKMEEITDVQVMKVLRTFPEDGRRTKKAAFDAWFKWAIRTRRLEKNPMDLLPAVKRPKRKYVEVFPDADAAALMQLPARDGELLQIMLQAGLRKAECRHLRRGDIDLDTNRLVVRKGKGSKPRIVPLTIHLRLRLSAWFREEPLPKEAYLWPTGSPGGRNQFRTKPMSESSFVRWWGRVIEAAGVEYRNPHTTRHTFAATWLRRGGSLITLSRVMGHESIQTTADEYGHLDLVDVERELLAVEQADPLLVSSVQEIRPVEQTRMNTGIEAPTGVEPV